MKSEAELKFLKLLRKSPKSKEELAEMDQWRILFVAELKQEIKGLSQELLASGSKYVDPWIMVNTKHSYPEAIDILIKHIPQNYHDRNKEGIFRALTVKEAKGKANASLIEEYNKTPKEKDNLRWVIGNAIYIIINKDDVKGVISIVEDKTNGKSRSRFVSALGKIKSEETENVLIDLLEDEEMVLYAVQSLRRLKSKKAREKIKSLASSSNAVLRKEVQKALEKIDN
ncbi:MAG: HEAT repeat domain-containing protein [Sphingobacteriales bacterium]